MTHLIKKYGTDKIIQEDIGKIEDLLSLKLSQEHIDFLHLFSDCFLHECYYEKDDVYVCPVYFCGVSNKNPNIFSLIEGNIFYENHDYLPIAIDGGGWVFNISLNANSYGEIWLNAFDSGDENSFRFVSKSLSEFLSNLKLNEEF